MSEENKRVVRQFIEAFSAGDQATADACLAPDAEIVAKGFGELSGPRSRDLILATTAAFREVMPSGLQPNITSITAEGDRVAVEFEGNATLANGEEYANQYCMVYFLENGKIKRCHEYYCTILADEKILPLLGGVESKRKSAG